VRGTCRLNRSFASLANRTYSIPPDHLLISQESRGEQERGGRTVSLTANPKNANGTTTINPTDHAVVFGFHLKLETTSSRMRA